MKVAIFGKHTQRHHEWMLAKRNNRVVRVDIDRIQLSRMGLDETLTGVGIHPTTLAGLRLLEEARDVAREALTDEDPSLELMPLGHRRIAEGLAMYFRIQSDDESFVNVG